jgi:hypothetical protein
MKQELANYLNAETEKLKTEQKECKCGCPVLARNVMKRMNVSCHLSPPHNSLAVYRGNDLVAMASEGVEGPEVTIFGNKDSLRVLTFNDLDIIIDNWNQMQEMRTEARAERIAKIVQERLDSMVGK